MVKDRDEFYSNLKLQLEDTTTFPSDYMFKFIVPADENQVQEVKDIFKNKKKRWKSLKRNSRLQIKNNFSIEKMANTYLKKWIFK